MMVSVEAEVELLSIIHIQSWVSTAKLISVCNLYFHNFAVCAIFMSMQLPAMVEKVGILEKVGMGVLLEQIMFTQCSDTGVYSVSALYHHFNMFKHLHTGVDAGDGGNGDSGGNGGTGGDIGVENVETTQDFRGSIGKSILLSMSWFSFSD